MRVKPSWTYSSLVDDNVLEHCLTVGEVPSAEGHEMLVVEVVQRDELDLANRGAVVGTGPAEVLVAGVRVTPAEARQLARYLISAAGLIEA